MGTGTAYEQVESGYKILYVITAVRLPPYNGEKVGVFACVCVVCYAHGTGGNAHNEMHAFGRNTHTNTTHHAEKAAAQQQAAAQNATLLTRYQFRNPQIPTTRAAKRI